MRIYVAGPYNPIGASLHDASRIAQHHVDDAIEVSNRLIEKGHLIFCPHLSHYIHTHYSCRSDYNIWWYKEDDSFLEHWAEALYYIGPSRGADHELELAKKLGLRIFYSLKEVPDIGFKRE